MSRCVELGFRVLILRNLESLAPALLMRAQSMPGSIMAVSVHPLLWVETEELAATLPRLPPRAHPIALASVLPPRLPQAAEVAQAALPSPFLTAATAQGAQAAVRHRMQ